MRLDDRRWAGLLVLLGAAQFAIGLTLAESVAPGHNAGADVISALGVGPSAGIFNGSVLLIGVLFAASSYFVRRVYGTWHLPLVFVVGGVGAMGVGLFPLTNPTPHGISALVAFVASGLAPLLFAPRLPAPLNGLSLVLAALSLGALVLFLGGVYAGLGVGGMERMIVYPVLVWGIAFGGHLLTPSAA